MAKVVINSVGSLGDLNPFCLIGRELVKRGHEVRFATVSAYKNQVEAFGMKHYPVRPDLSPHDRDLFRRVMDEREGFDFLLELFLAPIRKTYEDLNLACQGADVLVSGSLAMAASLVHERRGIPWVSIGLQVTSFFSDYQFPVIPQAPWLRHPPLNHVSLVKTLKKVFRHQIDQKTGEWHRVRSDLGLKVYKNMFLDAVHSPQVQLAAFPTAFSERKLDWPTFRKHTGFIQRPPGEEKISADLEQFIRAGEAPYVFTLGSAAILNGEKFFDICAEVARKGQLRSVLVCGNLAPSLKEKLKDCPFIFVSGPQPYSALFPLAKGVVHQGGIGTTGEGLRAGIPTVIVPFGQDQYDNACHVTRLGCGTWCPAKSLTAGKLRRLLRQASSPLSLEASRSFAEKIRNENGLQKSVAAIEALVGRTHSYKSNHEMVRGLSLKMTEGRAELNP